MCRWALLLLTMKITTGHLKVSIGERWRHAKGLAPVTVGEEGVRDVENPCSEYKIGPQTDEGVCMGDGHYLCTECVFLSFKSPNSPISFEDRKKMKRKINSEWGDLSDM